MKTYVNVNIFTYANLLVRLSLSPQKLRATLKAASSSVDLCVEGMATAASSTAESEALKISFDHLVNSIDTAALLPKALSSQLISEPQRSECASEPDPYKKAEKFLGHLQRAVNGDSNKYHTFIQVLKETGQASIASCLGSE